MTQRSRQELAAPGKRQRLAELSEKLGALPMLRALHDRGRPSLTILAYHRVTPVDGGEQDPLDLDLVSATPQQFDWQMQFLRENLNPVPLTAVARYLEGSGVLPQRAVAVTFDDGFGDTYHHVFPVLRRHAVPATVFVTTGNVDSGEPFWFEIAARVMLRAPPETIRSSAHPDALPTGPSIIERRHSLRGLLDALKRMSHPARRTFVGEWRTRYAHFIESGSSDLSRPMAWSEIREMSSAGIDFGSHTVTHPILTQLGDAELSRELADSKRSIESHVDREVLALAYPLGTRGTYDDRVVKNARALGYRLGAVYVLGVNWQSSLAPFELRRQGVELHASRSYFKALLALPGWLA